MGVTPRDTTDDEDTRAPLPDAGQALASFYDRRAPAALAYCARLCAPEKIADAVEEAFGHVFAAAASATEPLREEALERRLRDAVRAAAAARAPKSGRRFERARADAERAYDALAGDDAPALGRSLLAEMIEAAPATEGEGWFDTSEFEWGARTAPIVGRPPEDDQPVATENPPPRRRLHFPHLAPGVRKRVAIVMLVLGTLLLAEAVVTVAWKEPFTGYLAAQAQDDLSKQLKKLDDGDGGLDAVDERSLAEIESDTARTEKRMSLLAARLDGNVGEGEALGRLKIKKIDADFVFVQGTQEASLRKGPGHYHPGTRLPGQGGTVGIAGHRTTYEAPFRKIDELKAGDRITLRMPYGLFTYEVTGHRIVPADFKEAFAGSGEKLVLSACHPLYSASERILVDAKLVSSEPLGSAIESNAPDLPGVPAKELAARRTAARLERLGDRNLGPGMTGRDVRELQRLLGMPVSGTFDADTSAAVLAFQRDHGLPQVGRAGSQTKRALARRPHPPSRPPTPADVPQQKQPDEGDGTQQYPPNGYDGQGNGTYTGPTQTTPYTPPYTPPSTGQPPSATGPGNGDGTDR